MTAKETLNRLKRRGIHDFYYEDEDSIIAMNDYAKEKCQELLLLVAEKANAKISYVPGSVNRAVVNKSSILNTVNLDEFVK